MSKKQVTGKKETLHTQGHEYLEQLQRLQAEFENYQKRVEKEQGEKAKYASFHLLQKLVSLVDVFEEALKSMQQDDAHTKGITMMYEQLLGILREEGVKVMDTKDKPFNPAEHEVLAKVQSEAEEGIVVEELQKGYWYHDKVLRHAKVKVSSGKP